MHSKNINRMERKKGNKILVKMMLIQGQSSKGYLLITDSKRILPKFRELLCYPGDKHTKENL
jgi:hypothetical protein